MKKKVFLGLITALIISLIYCFRPGYYFSVPVTLTDDDLPQISVSFGNESHQLDIRIGSRLPLFLSANLLNRLTKQPYEIAEWCDIYGNQHKGPSYIIPHVMIGGRPLKNIVAIESREGTTNRIGKFLGSHFNLLIDFPHHQLIACDKFKKLISRGNADNDWIAVPIEHSLAGISFLAHCDVGTVRLAIDTNSNINILHAPMIASNQLHSHSFIIGGSEFKETVFHSLHLPEQLREVDGFLGMDFLKKHAIYIDYKHKVAYIQPCESYCESIPLHFEARGGPVLEVSIQNKTYALEMDLGSGFPFTLNEKVVNEIDKVFYGSAKWLDVQGNNYQTPAFLIPQIQVGPLSFTDCIVNQNSEAFQTNAYTGNLPYTLDGMIGRAILEKYNLLFDLPNHIIYACDQLTVLQQKSIISKRVLKIPFIADKEGIILKITTDEGVQRFLLDTGTSHTCIQDNHASQTSIFKLGEYDLGPHSLIPIPMTKGISYNGLLGLDFLKKHLFYIDYPKRILYLDLQKIEKGAC